MRRIKIPRTSHMMSDTQIRSCESFRAHGNNRTFRIPDRYRRAVDTALSLRHYIQDTSRKWADYGSGLPEGRNCKGSPEPSCAVLCRSSLLVCEPRLLLSRLAHPALEQRVEIACVDCCVAAAKQDDGYVFAWVCDGWRCHLTAHCS
jgi:hypothetical protein